MREIEELYGELAPRLYRYLTRLTGNETLAQDILQETFLRAVEHVLVSSTVLEPAWFYTVARHYYFDLARRQSRQKINATAKVEQETASITPDTVLEMKERRRAVREVLEELPESYRTVLCLREYAELSYTEIGKVTGLSLPQVKVTLYRARQRFRLLYLGREQNGLSVCAKSTAGLPGRRMR